MNAKQFFKIRLYITALLAISIWTLLAWNHFHGGIPSHHILADEELPAFSNGWGALLLPMLTWFLLYRIHKSVFGSKPGASQPPKILLNKLYGFTASLVFGILLSVFFTLAYTQLCGYMLLGLLPLGIFFPIYRPEYLLGFVLGMTFTFGAVLPTGIGIIIGMLAFGLFVSLRYIIHFLRLKSA
ncbi:hypothetical protein Q0590_23995 [Rhodocytophaga aerolata]|uniref:Tripartite tricarboxylate transporter TctB family protein n=1 Tax=Rhodocytophaga aerolata TaxID=455078 RepID=A0ABT8RBI1_9BACT|nr:hypothetical protein [Rhodocytophaga aerolata]MDO1449359.1 hypothetical protein [Rhodocytophaga aerolata]